MQQALLGGGPKRGDEARVQGGVREALPHVSQRRQRVRPVHHHVEELLDAHRTYALVDIVPQHSPPPLHRSARRRAFLLAEWVHQPHPGSTHVRGGASTAVGGSACIRHPGRKLCSMGRALGCMQMSTACVPDVTHDHGLCALESRRFLRHNHQTMWKTRSSSHHPQCSVLPSHVVSRRVSQVTHPFELHHS